MWPTQDIIGHFFFKDSTARAWECNGAAEQSRQVRRAQSTSPGTSAWWKRSWRPLLAGMAFFLPDLSHPHYEIPSLSDLQRSNLLLKCLPCINNIIQIYINQFFTLTTIIISKQTPLTNSSSMSYKSKQLDPFFLSVLLDFAPREVFQNI